MSANDRQEGGDHYGPGQGLQHWDIVIKFKLDYFQGQITKYVMRWKHKHKTPEARIEDLKKAKHFLDKYIENAEDEAFPLRPVEDTDQWILMRESPGVKTWMCRRCRTPVTIHGSRHPPKDHVCPRPEDPQPHGYVDQG